MTCTMNHEWRIFVDVSCWGKSWYVTKISEVTHEFIRPMIYYDNYEEAKLHLDKITNNQ